MTKIKVLAWIHIALSGALLLAGLVLCVAMLMSPDKESRAPAMILPMFLTMAAFLLIPGLAGGIGLLFLQSWARVLIIILSVMHLVLFPVGTLLGGVGLWILLDRDAQKAFGDRTVAALMKRAIASPMRAGATPFQVPGVWLAIAGVGAGFIVVIGAGFMISGDAAPVEITSAFYPALGVLIVVLTLAGRAIFLRRGGGA